MIIMAPVNQRMENVFANQAGRGGVVINVRCLTRHLPNQSSNTLVVVRFTTLCFVL